ncbi:MAG TPA: hypothetical protein VN108_02690, partial [Marmoricola sp.]|nr:hypothetical protein [Marmoricola sp.]
SLKKSVPLPANILATIGQKSLLGAEYVELDDPATPQGQLRSGGRIGLSETGGYPGTEEVLSAVSLLLNNGGLTQISTITHELNLALVGHQASARDLLKQLNGFVGTLNSQKANLVSALDQMNHLAGTLSQDRATIANGLGTIAPGLRNLERDRQRLTATLATVGQFSDVATSVIKRSESGTLANLRAMKPVLAELEKSGAALPNSLMELTFPTPLQTTDRMFRGDYFNFFVTVDVSAKALAADLIGPADLKRLTAGATSTSSTGSSSTAAPTLMGLLAPAGLSKAPPGSGSASATPSTPPASCGFLANLLGGC